MLTYRQLAVIATVAIQPACFPALRKPSPGPQHASMPVNASLQVRKNDKGTELSPNLPGNSPDVHDESRFTITTDPAGLPLSCHAHVSQDADLFGRFDDYDCPPLGLTPSGWSFDFKSLTTGPMHLHSLQHRRIVQLAFQKPGIADSLTYYFRYIKRFKWWNGLSAPLLYQASGTVKAFALDNFAPSLAFGPRVFLGGGPTDFLGLNALVTISRSSAAADTARPYSLGLGAIADFGGWIQVGANYQTKDGRWYLIVGVRPEVWKPGASR